MKFNAFIAPRLEMLHVAIPVSGYVSSLSSLALPARTFNVIMSSHSQTKQPCPVVDLKQKNILSFTIKHDLCFFPIDTLYQIEKTPCF